MFHVCIFEGFTCIYGTPCLHPLTPTITLTLGVRPVRWSCFISSVPVVIVCLFNCCCNTLYIPLNHNNKCCSCSFVVFRLHFTLHTLSCWFESMKCSVRSFINVVYTRTYSYIYSSTIPHISPNHSNRWFSFLHIFVLTWCMYFHADVSCPMIQCNYNVDCSCSYYSWWVSGL